MKKGMYFIQVTDLVKTKKEYNLLLIFQQQHQMGQIYVKKKDGSWLQFEAESFRIDQSDTSTRFK